MSVCIALTKKTITICFINIYQIDKFVSVHRPSHFYALKMLFRFRKKNVFFANDEILTYFGCLNNTVCLFIYTTKFSFRKKWFENWIFWAHRHTHVPILPVSFATVSYFLRSFITFYLHLLSSVELLFYALAVDKNANIITFGWRKIKFN